jgi:RNA polymerase sigma-70 factor (ECF subfamily)
MVSAAALEQDGQWAAWMRAAQAGDRRAYDSVLRAITPFLRSLTRRYSNDPTRCEDIVQDVLLTIHRVRHTWDPSRPFSPWLAAIAARRSIDLLRRESRIARFERVDELALETFADPQPNNDAGESHSFADIAPLLDSLPPKQREALEALKVRGMSLQQAAESSGQSVAAIKVNMHRALKSLRRMVGTEK